MGERKGLVTLSQTSVRGSFRARGSPRDDQDLRPPKVHGAKWAQVDCEESHLGEGPWGYRQLYLWDPPVWRL